MKPILFQYGSIQIGSYGVMLATAFITAFLIINREFRKYGQDVELAWDLHFLAIFGGMFGSRILYILENFSHFLQEPLKLIFSSTGFSVLGGYILALVLCISRVIKSKQPFFKIADLYVVGMAIGYSIGRIGCILAGDGCYGLPTDVPWAMSFPRGIVSTLSSRNPELTAQFIKLFPGRQIPIDISVHPTPLYESLSVFILFLILMTYKWEIGKGKRFGFFLIWFGISRFLVEFIRLNPAVIANLSSGQFLSLFFVIAGILIMYYSKHKATTENTK